MKTISSVEGAYVIVKFEWSNDSGADMVIIDKDGRKNSYNLGQDPLSIKGEFFGLPTYGGTTFISIGDDHTQICLMELDTKYPELINVTVGENTGVIELEQLRKAIDKLLFASKFGYYVPKLNS